MTALRWMAGAVRGRAGVAAVVALGVAWGLQMHSMGWAQSAHYAQVRAFAAGQTEIDSWHWETRDKAWVEGHFYSVKAPGLAALTLPLYLGLDAAGAEAVARDAARNARSAEYPRWSPKDDPALENYGFDLERARATQITVEEYTPLVWALTLAGAVLPAMALLLLVRRVADRLEPGYGTLAAITLGLGTLVMPFASQYFSHVIAAGLGFGAFALLLRERGGPAKIGAVAGAGLLAGLAVSFEYALGLVGVVLLAYASARPRRVARGAAYAAGAFAGAAPALAFNQLALGSPLEFAYGSAVAEQGLSGHAELGLNDDGVFGISVPRLDAAVDLLFASRGLLTLTPVLALGVVGTVLMRRRGHRAEAAVVGAIAALYFLYNAGYWLPFGGGSPGARFFIPALPFLAVGLAFAYRRLPATTLALAIPSAIFMVAATLTFPLLGESGTGLWWDWLTRGILEHTLPTVLGVADGWLAAAPVLAAIAAALALTAVAAPRAEVADLRGALAAVLGWAVVSALGPSLAGDAVTPVDGGEGALRLILVGVGSSLAALALLRYLTRRAKRPSSTVVLPEPVAGERIS